MTRRVTPSLLLLVSALCLSACGAEPEPNPSTELDCGSGVGATVGADTYCVYDGALIIEGFSCPGNMVQHDLPGITACGPSGVAPGALPQPIRDTLITQFGPTLCEPSACRPDGAVGGPTPTCPGTDMPSVIFTCVRNVARQCGQRSEQVTCPDIDPDPVDPDPVDPDPVDPVEPVACESDGMSDDPDDCGPVPPVAPTRCWNGETIGPSMSCERNTEGDCGWKITPRACPDTFRGWIRDACGPSGEETVEVLIAELSPDSADPDTLVPPCGELLVAPGVINRKAYLNATSVASLMVDQALHPLGFIDAATPGQNITQCTDEADACSPMDWIHVQIGAMDAEAIEAQWSVVSGFDGELEDNLVRSITTNAPLQQVTRLERCTTPRPTCP